MDYQLARNLIVFQEVCYRYGCSACVVSSRKNLFSALSVKFVTPLNPSAREGFYTLSTLFSIKMKSLNNPNWEKLEDLVAEKAMGSIFATGGN